MIQHHLIIAGNFSILRQVHLRLIAQAPPPVSGFPFLFPFLHPLLASALGQSRTPGPALEHRVAQTLIHRPSPRPSFGSPGPSFSMVSRPVPVLHLPSHLKHLCIRKGRLQLMQSWRQLCTSSAPRRRRRPLLFRRPLLLLVLRLIVLSSLHQGSRRRLDLPLPRRRLSETPSTRRVLHSGRCQLQRREPLGRLRASPRVLASRRHLRDPRRRPHWRR